MTREQYMRTLQSYLTQCSAREAQELLDDVRQHFEEAQSFGLSEEEVCQRLGDPRDLAKAYLEEVPVHAQATATLGSQRGEYAGVHQLTVEVGQCDVELYRSDSEKTVVEVEDAATGEDNQIEVFFDAGHLKIRQRSATARFLFFLNTNRKNSNARVWLGSDFAGDVRVGTGSGSLYANGLSANNLSLGTGSGKAHVANIGANNISCKCGSGSVTLDSLNVAEKLSVASGAGGVAMSNVCAADISSTTGAGSVTFEKVDVSQRLNVNSGSGSVKVQTVTAQEFSCKVGSGSIKLEECHCPRLSLITASGSIKGACSSLDASLNTTSGSIRLSNAQTCNVTANTVSGSIRLTLPAEQEMTVNTTIVASGHVDIGYPSTMRSEGNRRVFVVGNGGHTLNLRSVSGSIAVTPCE